MTAKPWMKFYPTDWRSDPGLRLCSLSARGAWIDIIALAHEGAPYGHLSFNGTAVEVEAIASLLGRPVLEVRRAIEELERHGVFSRNDSGVIYSRRMVRDKAKAEIDRENGKGGGNPKLDRPVNLGVNPPVNGQVKAQSPESRVRHDVVDDARARQAPAKSMISEAAWQIATEIGQEAGFHTPQDWPPGWVGAPMRVQGFLDGGYEPDVIKIGAIETLRKKRDGVPESFSYFDKPIAAARARAERPLPKLVEIGAQTVEVQGTRHATNRNSGGGFALNAVEFARRAADSSGAS
jgi:hypothetical protein